VRRASAGVQEVPGMQLPLRAAVLAGSLHALLALSIAPLPARAVALAATTDACTERMGAGWYTDPNTGFCERSRSPSPPPPPPPSTIISTRPIGPIQPADPPDVTVRATYTLPFIALETGASEKSYEFSVASTTEVSVSLTGMDRDIDCNVNGRRCTNRGGTADDSWSGTLHAGTHTVTVYPYGGGSGSWTLGVGGTPVSPPAPAPPPPPSDPGPPDSRPSDHASRSRTYALRLSATFDVSVRLTGMTADFDCRIGQSDCTNQSGTADDSWSGTLDAGEHKIVVYPRTGVSGSYTLTVSVETPSTGGSEGTRTQVTTLVDVSRTGVFSSQNHSFALSRSADVEVALTGLTIDFDCRVGSSRCTNRWGTQDDSWSGNLAAGSHNVVVYPYDPGPGDYSLTVTATTTLGVVTTPTGVGPGDMVCDQEGEVVDEDSCIQIPEGGVITVTGEDPGEDPGPPPGAGPGEGDPGPGDGGDGGDGGGGGGGPPAPTPSGGSLAAATSDINCEGWNIDDGDGFDADRLNEDGTTRKHRALDIQVSSPDASFFALADGTITSYASSPTCGHQIAVRLASGGRHVYCHMDQEDRLPAGTTVRVGDRIGSYGPSGVTFGPHLHLKVTDSNDQPIDPVEAAGGESVMMDAGFSFNSSDSEHCAEE